MKQRLVVAIAVTIVTGVVVLAVPVRAESPACTTAEVLCYQPAAQKLIDTITTVNEPSIAVPDWLQ